jgi:hypothetical protein
MLEYYRDRLNWTESQMDLDTDDFDEEELDEDATSKMMRQAREEFYAEIKDLLTQPMPDTKFVKLLEVLQGLDEEQNLVPNAPKEFAQAGVSDFSLLAVAYGLAFPPPEIPDIRPPNQIQPLLPPTPVQKRAHEDDLYAK